MTTTQDSPRPITEEMGPGAKETTVRGSDAHGSDDDRADRLPARLRGIHYDVAVLDPSRSRWEHNLAFEIEQFNALPLTSRNLPVLTFTPEQAIKRGATEAELLRFAPLTPNAVRSMVLRARALAEADAQEVRAQARLIVAERAAQGLELPERIDLATFTPNPVPFLVDGLWPIGGVFGLFAQRKAGKSTVVRDIVRSVLTGDDLFGRFPVHVGPDTEVVLIDTENTIDQIHYEYRAAGIPDLGRINLRSIRGAERTFDLRVPQVQERWAEQIKPGSVIIFDCLYSVLAALGIPENDDTVAGLVVGFRALAAQCDALGGALVHHLGKDAERGARGHSSIEGNTDVVCQITTDGLPDADSPRYLSALGRNGVKVETSLLTLGSDHRLRLETVAEVKAERRQATLDADSAKVLAAIQEHPRCTAAAIVDATGLPDKRARAATQHLESIGLARDEGTARTRQAWVAAEHDSGPVDRFTTVADTARQRVAGAGK